MSAVTDADPISDIGWFDGHPDREFRARQCDDDRIWLIRRFRGVFLRTAITTQLPDDTDAAIRPAWFAAVYPDMLMTDARRRAGGRR